MSDIRPAPVFFAPKHEAAPAASQDVEKFFELERRNSGQARKLQLLGRARDPKHMLEILATDPAAINGPLTEWITRILFILLPVYALVLAILYWRQRADFYFVDHLVFALNAFRFIFAVSLIAIGLAQVVSGGAVTSLGLGAVWLYFLLAMKRFYGQSWGWTVAKFALTSLLFGVFALGPALIGAFVAVLLNI